MTTEIEVGTKVVFTLDELDVRALESSPDDQLHTVLGWHLQLDDYEVQRPGEAVAFDAHAWITAAMNLSDGLASYVQALENVKFERHEAVQIAIAMQTVLLSGACAREGENPDSTV